MPDKAENYDKASFAALKDALAVERKARVTYTHYIDLEGVRFDADDLLETLHEVDGGDVVTRFSREKTELLKRIGVLAYEGNSRWCSGARLGPHGEEFIRLLGTLIDDAEAADKYRKLVEEQD